MNPRRRYFTILLAVGDVSLMYISLALAFALRTGSTSFLGGIETTEYLLYFSVLHAVWLCILFLLDFYDFPPVKDTFEFLSNVAIFFVCALIAGSFYFYFQPIEIITPKTILLVDVLILSMSILLWRAFICGMLRLINYRERLLVIGSKAALKEITSQVLVSNRYSLMTCTTDRPLDNERLREQITTNEPDLIVLAFKSREEERIIGDVFGHLPLGLNYISAMTFYEESMRKLPLDTIDEVWFLENVRRRGKFHDFLKRSFDIIFSVLGLAITALVFPCIAAIIKIASPGPIFYKQQRVGKGDRIFYMYKFRTMRPEAERENPSWAVENDERIIPFGQILRLLHLDELPQFYNILKGDVSFVGPRPEWLEFVKIYRDHIPFYDIRHVIKPGLTGWAQIRHHSGALLEDVREKLEYDLFYIKHHTSMFDLGIIFQTIGKILAKSAKDVWTLMLEVSEKVIRRLRLKVTGELATHRLSTGDNNILVICDNAGHQERLSEFLGTMGFTTLVTSSSKDALDIVKRKAIRMAIVDIELLRLMDEYSLLKRMKDIDKELKVLLITEFGTDEKIELCNRLGTCTNLGPSFDVAEIKRNLEQALPLDIPKHVDERIKKEIAEDVIIQ